MRGRGLDFEHRFKTSRWAEDLLIRAISTHANILAKRYGLSEVRSAEALANVEIGTDKEPDLLVFDVTRLNKTELHKLKSVDLERLDRRLLKKGQPFGFVYEKATAAIEVEFSPYKAKEMKGRHWAPKTPEQWERRPLKHAKPPVAPNIWVKEQDISRLTAWEDRTRVPIIVAHIFDQEAFAISLRRVTDKARLLARARTDDEFKKLQVTSGIFHKEQDYDRVDAQGAKERKPVYVVAPAAATKIGDVTGVTVEAQLGVSASQKYVSHILFSGGSLEMTPSFLGLLLKPMRA